MRSMLNFPSDTNFDKHARQDFCQPSESHTPFADAASITWQRNGSNQSTHAWRAQITETVAVTRFHAPGAGATFGDFP